MINNESNKVIGNLNLDGTLVDKELYDEVTNDSFLIE